jgi:phosphoglycolate phosphatase-like HAD superfamily hydrolase
MTKRNAIIFDLDGTLCDVTHRRHFVATKPRNWKAWNEGMPNDTPNTAVAFVFQALDYFIGHNLNDTDIIFVSGRSDDYREKTEEWLSRHGFEYNALYMRKYKDNRDDSIVKGEIADEIEKTHNILMVFDDRKRVLDAWQARGIWTFDVGQGRGDF